MWQDCTLVRAENILACYLINLETTDKAALEYCAQFWSPGYKDRFDRKDMLAQERVQRRLIKIWLEFDGFSYGEILNRLGLFSFMQN